MVFGKVLSDVIFKLAEYLVVNIDMFVFITLNNVLLRGHGLKKLG